MRRFILLPLAVCAASGLALVQPVPSAAGDSDGVIVNMDALLLPEPAPVPELPPAKTAPVAKRSVPLPRPKPERASAGVATPGLVPDARLPAPSATVAVAVTPPKADLPVSIVENFPVELRGAASDPFAGAAARDPAAGFALIGSVRFSAGTPLLSAEAQSVLDGIALGLQASTARIRLAAYSGKAGDLSSQVRRLSLDRARAVRGYLASRGVAFERIDVMPFGGAVRGASDRVDVLAPAD